VAATSRRTGYRPVAAQPAEALGEGRRTVQSILDNARELFLDRGYVSTSSRTSPQPQGFPRDVLDVLRHQAGRPSFAGENVEEEGLAIAREFAELPPEPHSTRSPVG